MRIESHTQRGHVLADLSRGVVDARDLQYRQGQYGDVIADATSEVLEPGALRSVTWSHLIDDDEVGLGATHRGEQQRNTHPKEDSWLPKQN
jgi:hypothetical protein